MKLELWNRFGRPPRFRPPTPQDRVLCFLAETKTPRSIRQIQEAVPDCGNLGNTLFIAVTRGLVRTRREGDKLLYEPTKNIDAQLKRIKSNAAEIDRFRTMYEQGVPIADICAEFNLSHTSVGKWRRQFGISERPRGGSKRR